MFGKGTEGDHTVSIQPFKNPNCRDWKMYLMRQSRLFSIQSVQRVQRIQRGRAYFSDNINCLSGRKEVIFIVCLMCTINLRSMLGFYDDFINFRNTMDQSLFQIPYWGAESQNCCLSSLTCLLRVFKKTLKIRKWTSRLQEWDLVVFVKVVNSYTL